MINAMRMRQRIKATDVLSDAQLDDLAGVLTGLVEGVRDALGAGFVGACLVGSFARGAGDSYSDVDTPN
jgi:hypothetical protein